MPSLYESTVNTGEVSSSNFTTLYNASGLAVPNAGAGSITGNLNVGGNLIVQGTSLLQGAVSLGSTLSLPNYTFPLPDGTTDQVLVTDGSGNLYFTDVSSIPGAAYQIQANTASGGADLTLLDSAGGTDSVKFASGTNITVVRTDENTITISSSADDIPDGTAAGEVLVWNGTAWTANNEVTSLTAADRLVTEFKNTSTTTGSSALFRRNYGSVAYTTDLSSAIAFQFDSDSQPLTTQGAVGVIYDAANPSIIGVTSIDNFTNRIVVSRISSTDIEFNGTNLVLNSNFAGTTPTDNAVIAVERGTVEPNASLSWTEATDEWVLTNDLLIQGGDLKTTAAIGNLFNDITPVVNIGNGATTEVNLGNDFLGRVQVKSPQLDVNGNATIALDLAVNGGGPGGTADITSTATQGNLFNAGVLDINIGNGTTAVRLGSDSATSEVVIKSENLVGVRATQDVFDTVATTVNAFGAATAVNIGAATGVTTIEHDLTVQGGNINLNGVATPGQQPFLTFATQPDGVNSQYGLRGKSALDDPWFIGAGSTGDDQGYLEIATGDNIGGTNNGGQIYVRQYNGATPLAGVPWFGGNGVVVNELTLLDSVGNTVIPNNLTVDSGTLFVNAANNRVGVNNTNPSYELHVNSSEAGPNDSAQFALTNTERTMLLTNNANDDLLTLNYNGANRLQFNLTNQWFNSGRLGVNTATPTRTFSVVGDADITGDVSAGSFTVDGGHTTIDTVTTTTTSTAQVSITSTSNTVTRSSKFQIQITDNATGNIHVLEAMLFFQGTTAYLTTYAEMYNSTSLATFAADVSGGNTRLLATPASTNNTTFKVTRIGVSI